jgi:hypothetical protein
MSSARRLRILVNLAAGGGGHARLEASRARPPR